MREAAFADQPQKLPLIAADKTLARECTNAAATAQIMAKHLLVASASTAPRLERADALVSAFATWGQVTRHMDLVEQYAPNTSAAGRQEQRELQVALAEFRSRAFPHPSRAQEAA